jgi:hypothetical protein
MQLTYSLAVIPVSRFQRRAKDLEKKTQDTSGLTSESISTQYSLLESSSKMSKDTSRWDSPQSLATWKKMVTEQRGEYSQRVKSALHTKESESISWPTPTACDTEGGISMDVKTNGKRFYRENKDGVKWGVKLRDAVNAEESWPTPRASEYKDCGPVGSKSQVHMEKRSYLCAKVKDPDKPIGKLNPEWVEWLMGVPIGLTELDF